MCRFSEWRIVEPNGTAGSLLLAWEEGLEVEIVSVESFFIAAKVKDDVLASSWGLIGVYLSYSDQERLMQFSELSLLVQCHSQPSRESRSLGLITGRGWSISWKD
ncbi:hypothetical protein PIB30_064230 [Stylosanthes scabra]|uniref:Uncharacterized protein n=1 Tax=Stylosanthes scabra TaxID=79078 RepID=A0ABU6QL53_9FABA|nr:hypothetical protein [Stylosanthes scabra]